jgi:hypothetical protein
MNSDAKADIRLSAQRALWGRVPQSLRAFSIELNENVIRVRSIFDETMAEADKELLSEAGSEIVADYPAPFTIDEEFLKIPSGREMQHLQSLIYLRYEP